MTGTLEQSRFIVIDVEGNGQQPPEIVEIAVVTMDGLSVAGEPRTWLVKPSQPITPIVTRKVHGIKNADVEDAPAFADVEAEVLGLLGDRIPIAHNARVEVDVLARQLPAWQPPLVVDTLRLARALWPGLLAGYTLDKLLEHACIDTAGLGGKRHRAGFDAAATALLFAALAKDCTTEQVLTLGCLPSHSPAPTPSPDQGALF